MRVNKRIAATVAGAVAAAGTVTGVAFAVNAAAPEPPSDVVTLVGSDGEPATAENSSPAPDTTTAATTTATTVPVPAGQTGQSVPARQGAEPATTTNPPAKKPRTVTGMTNDDAKAPAKDSGPAPAQPAPADPEPVPINTDEPGSHLAPPGVGMTPPPSPPAPPPPAPNPGGGPAPDPEG